ncbi:MAG: hypothetical protein HQ503_15640 [Rhodospirillales bacterium]|nr:hypothetical protein [Rhodospirillales bacterium]
MMLNLRSILIIGVIVLLPLRQGSAQDGAEFQPFIGDYVGQTVFAAAQGLAKRDLDVSIRRETGGFSLKWVTVSHKPNGKSKRSEYFVVFKSSKRPGFYISTDRINRMGGRVPIDPLKGDPQVWAKIQGKTLTVYAVLITDSGAHEVQTYIRRLVPGGMKLKFDRVRDGKPLKSISATLKTKNQTLNLR